MIQIETCINRLNSKRLQNFQFQARIVILGGNHKNAYFLKKYVEFVETRIFILVIIFAISSQK